MKLILSSSVVLVAAVAVLGQTGAPMPPAAQKALVSEYCVSCHNERLRSGGFSWTSVDWDHPAKSAEQLEKVIRKVRVGLMPPIGAPRPDAPAMKAFTTGIEQTIDRAFASEPNPGRPLLHRLNRTEYHNSIRDLLGVDADVTSLLPADDMSHGFDNMADVLTVSPALMQGYLRAASKISRQAVGDPKVSPYVTTYQLTKSESQTRHVDGAPLGTRGGISLIHDFPADGEYVFKASLYFDIDGPLFGRGLGAGQQLEISVNGARVAIFDINPKMTKWDELKTAPVPVKAGPQRVSAAFISHFDGPVEDVIMPVEQTLVDLNMSDTPGYTALHHLHDLAISGPFKVTGVDETPSRKKIFSCRPSAGAEELPCAKKIIAILARQAFRRPVNDADMEALLSLYQRERNKSNFESGIRVAVQAIIASPEFVFRSEQTPPNIADGKNYRISDLELATRLSYFLWSSQPDDELLTIASQGKLKAPAELERQVRRMLSDPKSETLATNFASQWLHLRNLRDAQPDAYLYPNFTRNLGRSMERETELLFDSIVREDRSVLDLLTADYTFVDEVLAKHYGIPNILGSRFQRVQIADKNRAGLLGQSSLLTLTSASIRTSPVQRGKYVMSVLLGTPPPTPPPNVPPLAENAPSGDARPLSVRERMEQHRANPNCAACHRMIDPLGFALENFDAVGLWRDTDSGFRVDATGKMFDGSTLDGPASLRQALLNHSDAFLATFTENLLAYGLGRVLQPYDMPSVRSVQHEAARDHDRFSAYVLAIVRSTPFQMSRANRSETDVH